MDALPLLLGKEPAQGCCCAYHVVTESVTVFPVGPGFLGSRPNPCATSDTKVSLALRVFGLGRPWSCRGELIPPWPASLTRCPAQLLTAPSPPFRSLIPLLPTSHDVLSVFLLFGFLPAEALSTSPKQSGPSHCTFTGQQNLVLKELRLPGRGKYPQAF